ncbi:CPCC family cysteine-rich protein [Peribacillus sp. NPDC094092]
MQRVKCSCCGFPTLDERRSYEICELCDWEEDGQEDLYTDEVWGGPN